MLMPIREQTNVTSHLISYSKNLHIKISIQLICIKWIKQRIDAFTFIFNIVDLKFILNYSGEKNEKHRHVTKNELTSNCQGACKYCLDIHPEKSILMLISFSIIKKVAVIIKSHRKKSHNFR